MSERVDDSTNLEPTASIEACHAMVELAQSLYEHAGRFIDGSQYTRAAVSIAHAYWEQRVEYETVLLQDGSQQKPVFNYRTRDNIDIPFEDAKSRLRVHIIVSKANELGLEINPSDYGLTAGQLELDKETVETATRAAKEASRTKAREESHHKYREKIDSERHSLTTLLQMPKVKQVTESSILEPVSLIDKPIRKDNITPTILTVLGSIARRGFLDAVETCEGTESKAQLIWREENISNALDKLTAKYAGTVAAVIGIKLPVTDDFINEYFNKNDINGVVAESVSRLQFDAILTPGSKKPFISRVNTVIYQALNDNGDRRVVTTVRKADRLVAELAIQSLINEAQAVRTIMDSTSYEVLAGLPSLGKASR